MEPKGAIIGNHWQMVKPQKRQELSHNRCRRCDQLSTKAHTRPSAFVTHFGVDCVTAACRELPHRCGGEHERRDYHCEERCVLHRILIRRRPSVAAVATDTALLVLRADRWRGN